MFFLSWPPSIPPIPQTCLHQRNDDHHLLTQRSPFCDPSFLNSDRSVSQIKRRFICQVCFPFARLYTQSMPHSPIFRNSTASGPKEVTRVHSKISQNCFSTGRGGEMDVGETFDTDEVWKGRGAEAREHSHWPSCTTLCQGTFDPPSSFLYQPILTLFQLQHKSHLHTRHHVSINCIKGTGQTLRCHQ